MAAICLNFNRERTLARGYVVKLKITNATALQNKIHPRPLVELCGYKYCAGKTMPNVKMVPRIPHPTAQRTSPPPMEGNSSNFMV